MIRAEENYSRLTVVEEIIWRRERDSYACTQLYTHVPACTERHSTDTYLLVLSGTPVLALLLGQGLGRGSLVLIVWN